MFIDICSIVDTFRAGIGLLGKPSVLTERCTSEISVRTLAVGSPLIMVPGRWRDERGASSPPFEACPKVNIGPGQHGMYEICIACHWDTPSFA